MRAVERDRETGCAACHVEHQGRGADIRATFSDRQCAGCHDVGSFDRHPEFDFAAEAIPDNAGLTFTHIRHVDFVMEELALDGAEDACLACHSPAPEGRGFVPVSFEVACAACHLTGDVESAELPIQPRGVPLLRGAGDGAVLTLGVEALETVRARLAPGEQWARRTSAAQFDVEDGVVVRAGVEHADPWILHNLRRLRRALYPSGGLADLLTASADIAPADRRVLYDEALATLRGRTDELRGRDEDWVRVTLLEFDGMMEALDRRIGETGAAHDDAPFHLGAPDPRTGGRELPAVPHARAVVRPVRGVPRVPSRQGRSAAASMNAAGRVAVASAESPPTGPVCFRRHRNDGRRRSPCVRRRPPSAQSDAAALRDQRDRHHVGSRAAGALRGPAAARAVAPDAGRPAPPGLASDPAGPPRTRAFQVAMVLFIVSGVAGVWFHYSSNAAFELQIRPAIDGWRVVRESLAGPAPALAPATMVQLGLLGLIYTYRHPFLERKPSQSESEAVLGRGGCTAVDT